MYEQYLQHHGIKGQKWGVRRFQNYDGTLTSAGKRRNQANESRSAMGSVKSSLKKAKRERKIVKKAYDESFSRAVNTLQIGKKAIARWEKAVDDAHAYDKKNAVYKKAKTDYKAAKRQYKNDRRKAIEETSKELNKNASKTEKLLFNEATMRTAAKYMVDNNMSMSDAKKRANSEAVQNTAAILAVAGIIAVTKLKG